MGALVNSMVHTVMYTYYGLTALGPSVRKHIGKYKKRVTQLQLVSILYYYKIKFGRAQHHLSFVHTMSNAFIFNFSSHPLFA